MYKKSFLPQRHEDTKFYSSFSSCLRVFVASLYAFLVSGCISLDSSAKRDEVAQMRSGVSQELTKIKEEINSLEGRMEELQYKIDKISKMQSQQLNELNATLKDWRKDIQNDTEKKISALESKIQMLEQKQAQDKKELQDRTNIVVEEVAKENKELRRQIDAIKKPSAGGQITEEGYYVVGEGDTLSKIAQMFGVSIKSLMEANGITDPNSIRVGQKLIIPEKK